jgi:NitT/TauT family transport system substrate-binding protein
MTLCSTLLRGLRRSLALTTLSLAAAVPFGAGAQTPEPLKVRLDWTPWGVHAALHLAQQKGWFKDAGLDVQAEDGNGSVSTLQLVGNSDQFDVGHAALASLMIARDKGLPVKAVAVFARLSDVGLLVPKGSGIAGPKDLRGKKVAYTAGSLEAPFIDAFLAAGGLTKNDIELVNVDAAGKIGTYAAGRTDAVFSTIPFVLPSVQQTRASEAIRFSDYKLNMPSFGLFASERKLATRREAIAKFSSIVASSWAYVYAGHQDEAVDAIVAQRPQSRLDKKVLRGQIDALQPFFSSPASADRPIGVIVPADWTIAVKTLTDVQLIKSGKPATDYYDADLIRPVKLK